MQTGDRGISQFSDGTPNSGENMILRRIQTRQSHVIKRLSDALEKLTRKVNIVGPDTEENLGIPRRFGLLQSMFRKQDGVGRRGARSGNSDGETSQTACTGSVDLVKSHLIYSLKDKLPEYEEFLNSKQLEISHSALRPFLSSPICNFLLDGPPVQGNFEDSAWIPYSHAVRGLLLDPENTSWLELDLNNFLNAVDLIGTVERDDTGKEVHRDNTGKKVHRDNIGKEVLRYEQQYNDEGEQNDPNPGTAQRALERRRDEEAQNDGDTEEVLRHLPRRWRRIRTWCFNRLFPPLSAAVCIFNITTALGYVMLMNDPAPPKSSYIIGALVTWFLTTGVMVCHGILTADTMKDYARQLVILAMFMCFVFAVVFHFAGASNFASSFLVGITTAILLLQIW